MTNLTRFYLLATITIVIVTQIGIAKGESETPPPEDEDSEKKCGENEVYRACMNTCLPTCKNHGSQPLGNCQEECISGCECEEGFVRDEYNDECVKPDDCEDPEYTTYELNKRECRENEVYQECKSTCPPTCKSHGNPPLARCVGECNSGCECELGFVKDEENDDKCIKPDECPESTTDEPKEECRENEVYETCKNTCPPTCKSHGIHLLARCEEVCKSGCECEDGFVKDEDNDDKCIKPDECLKSTTDEPNEECRENEVYETCKNTCPPTCKSHGIHLLARCEEVCKSGCECEDGFVKDEDNDDKCIKPDECLKSTTDEPNGSSQ